MSIALTCACWRARATTRPGNIRQHRITTGLPFSPPSPRGRLQLSLAEIRSPSNHGCCIFRSRLTQQPARCISVSPTREPNSDSPTQITRGERMERNRITRRNWLVGTGMSLATLAANPKTAMAGITQPQNPEPQESDAVKADRMRRMQWWHEARFGMFIHFGLYSVLGRHEWAMEDEGIPVHEYEQLAKQFNPTPNAARAWAKLAKQAGQKYMVMTSKHHEGFCNFDTKLTNYCAAKQAAGRDLLREYVEAARAEGLRFGFYYSLMDWHHPDGARCATDEDARKRFVEYTHGLVREIMTNYGKVDVLWYDVDWPLDAHQWESERMNKMVYELQPDIVVNNRNGLPGDFSTPEQQITAASGGRSWEACMT